MDNRIFVLKYKNGKFVKRDDSTGPMSTGGYPYEVDTLMEATFFPTQEAAAKYAGVMNWDSIETKVYQVDFALGEGMDFPVVWETCNHHCVETPASTAFTAKHYLDCPVWVNRLPHG